LNPLVLMEPSPSSSPLNCLSSTGDVIACLSHWGGGELMMMASCEWRTANSEGRPASGALQVQPQSFPITTRAALFKLKHLMGFAFPCCYSIKRISRLSEYSLLSLS
jgi:hypothetical protein